MNGRLLLLAFFILAIVSPSHCRGTVSHAVSNGKSGEKCTNKGRHCLSDMRCTNKKCQCPNGFKGDAELECAKSDEQLCSMTGDGTSNVNGYGGSSAAVNLPCTYRASRFVVRSSGSKHSYCGIEIHVTNELQRDNYVARAVHVAVGMTESALQVQTNTDVMVTGTFSRKQYDYTIRAGHLEVFPWGSATPPKRQREDVINTTVNEADNVVVIELPTCRSRIKFRAYDNTRNNQQQLPGVSIAVPQDAEFVHERGDYPFSLCGRAQDPKSLYKNRAKDLQLSGAADAIVWDVLLQRPQQIDNPYAEQCEQAMQLLAASSHQQDHLKACSFLLTKKRLRACLRKKGLSPLEVFNSCLSYQQLPTDAHACENLQTASGSCKNTWNGPTKYTCQ